MRSQAPHMHARRASIAMTVAERERRLGHDDGFQRSLLLDAIDIEQHVRSLSRDEACLASGVPVGSFDDGSLSTTRIRAALSALRAQPDGRRLASLFEMQDLACLLGGVLDEAA